MKNFSSKLSGDATYYEGDLWIRGNLEIKRKIVNQKIHWGHARFFVGSY